MIGKDYQDFIKKVIDAEMGAFNGATGQEVIEKLKAGALQEKPNMTFKEWQTIKEQFMIYVFNELIKNNAELRNELGNHLYDKLR